MEPTIAAALASSSVASSALSTVASKSAASVSSVLASAGSVTAVNPVTPDALVNGFATLVGALIGAMLAYALQRRFQKSIEHKNDLISAHRLMFALLQQINTIVLIQRDYIFSELKNPGRFLSIPATPPFDTTKDTLQPIELTFLLDTKDGRAILYDFYIAQENYIAALNQWNIRSALHNEKVQPAFAASGIQNGATITVEVLRESLGAHVFGSLVNSTENCLGSLRRAFQKLYAVKIKARAYLVLHFKSNDFTDFDFNETYGLAGE